MLCRRTADEPLMNRTDPAQPKVAEVLAALSYALDLSSEGQPVGHAARTCVLGMRLAREIGLDETGRGDLYYALLLKDAGCSSNASRMYHLMGSDDIRAKREVKATDWTRVGWETVQYALSHVRKGAPFLERVRGLYEMARNQRPHAQDLVQIRCERGASIARRLGLTEPTAEAIYALDEHWNGHGYPNGWRGTGIPLLARVISISQNLEIFFTKRTVAAAMAMIGERSGSWFDPDLVRAAVALHQRGTLFHELNRSGEWVAAAPAAGEDFNASCIG